MKEFLHRIIEKAYIEWRLLIDYWYLWLAMVILCSIYVYIRVKYKTK